MLGWQHSQAWCQEDNLTGKNTEFSLTTLLGICSSGETNNTNDISSLNVLMLLLERNIGLGLLQLAHDLNCLAFGLADVEVERVRCGSLGDDTETNANLLLGLSLSLLEVCVILQVVLELVVLYIPILTCVSCTVRMSPLTTWNL